jgi:hypothetical protein
MRSRTITVAALLTFSMVTGGWLIVRGTHEAGSTPAEAQRLFNQVFSHIERFYVDSFRADALPESCRRNALRAGRSVHDASSA